MADLFGNINPLSLVAQRFSPGAPSTASNLVGALTGAITQGRKQVADQELKGAITAGVSGTATAEQLGLMFQRDPDRALKVLEGAGAVTAQGQKKLANTAFKIQNITDPNQRNQAIQQVVQQMQSGGADPSVFANLIGQSPQQQNATLKGLQLAALSVKDRGAADVAQQKLGFEERRTAATEQQAATAARKVANDAADQRRTNVRLVKKATDAANAGVTIDAKGRRSINSDVTGLIKESVAIHSAAKSLEGLESLGSAAARLAAVFKFMKALDPTSVVRETEQGQVYAASGAASQLAGQLNSILGKGKLTDAGFKDLVATSKNIANSSLTSSQGAVSSYLDTYENTLPNSFKSRLASRLPDLFVLPKAQPAAPDTTGTAQVSPAPAVAPTSIGRFQIKVLN